MTDPLVERVAQALRDEWFESEASDDFRGLARAAIAAIREAEPLTSTPEPSTTETDGEAAISQDPPPGFEWEYRAVTGSTWRDEPLPHWRKVERRPVGKPERMED